MIEDKDKKTKERPDFTVGMFKYRAELIPTALVIAQEDGEGMAMNPGHKQTEVGVLPKPAVIPMVLGVRSLRDRGVCARGVRGCRCAQPPANGWHPYGMIRAVHAKEIFATYPAARVSASQAGGLEAISRWLRSNATIPPEPNVPPEPNAQPTRIPEGCQP